MNMNIKNAIVENATFAEILFGCNNEFEWNGYSICKNSIDVNQSVQNQLYRRNRVEWSSACYSIWSGEVSLKSVYLVEQRRLIGVL